MFEEDLYIVLNKRSAKTVVAMLKNAHWLKSEIDAICSLKKPAEDFSLDDFLEYLSSKRVEIAAEIKSYWPSFLEPIHNSPLDSAQNLKGMKAALVGPSEGLYSKHDENDDIDRFEYVVRMNSGWPPKEELQEFAGRKTNGVIHCCTDDVLLKDEDFSGTGEVSHFYYQFNLLAPHNTRLFENYGAALVNLSKLYGDLRKHLGTQPNTGTVAITYLLNSPLEELHLFGVSGYLENYRPGYQGDGALRFRHAGQEEIWPHLVHPQINYLKNLARTHDKLHYDSCFELITNFGEN